MILMEWKSGYSVEIDEIDKQHQVLVNTINELYTAMKTGQGKDAMEKILTALSDYTVEHFATEEKYMTQWHFVGYEAHKEEHEKFIVKVSDFIEGFKNGKLLLSLEILNFLKEWLIYHIAGTDQKYVEFFHGHGLH